MFVGFDFPYAYPSGLAASLGIAGLPWTALWTYLAERIRDDPYTNENNRFEVAAATNARLTHQAFWGCPQTAHLDHLSSYRDQVRYRTEDGTPGLAEWRVVESFLIERGMRPHSTWKLLGAGSVGSQSLTGIPVVSRLRRDPFLSAFSVVWPFEVVVPELPEGRPAIVHGEIWPSLMQVPTVEGQVKDERQVVGLAEELRRQDRAGVLRELFVAGESSVAKEEGWILGVEGGALGTGALGSGAATAPSAPSAGFEPAHPASEASALSPELRGLAGAQVAC